MRIPVAMFPNAFGGIPAEADLAAIVEAVKTGKWAPQVAQARVLFKAWQAVNPALDSNGSPEAKAYGEFKKSLPAFCISGTAENRKKPLVHSNLLQIDFDKLNGNLTTLRDQLREDAFIRFGFISPSGDGLKAGIAIDGDHHLESFLSAQEYFRRCYNREIDAAVKDRLRLCFVSHDPEAWMHEKADVLPITVPVVEEKLPLSLGPSPIVPDGTMPKSRAEIAGTMLTKLVWIDSDTGFCECPGIARHTGTNGEKDCRITLGTPGKDKSPPTIHCFHNSCKIVVESMNHRLRSDVAKAEKAAKHDTGGQDSHWEGESVQESTEDRHSRVQGLLLAGEFNVNNVLVRPPPVFLLGSACICTAGNLTAISAGVKSGKTSALTAMMSAAMAGQPGQPDGLDFLGFSSCNPSGKALIHIDTEQSREDHDEMIRRALRRAGLETPPWWFHSFCLTGLPVKDLQEALWESMELCWLGHRGLHSVMVDGAADLLADVNDPPSSNALVSDLHGKAIHYKCPIIGIIHFNPGTEKTRGHFGSQLERKSETNLRLERDGDSDVVVMWSDKNRRAPILKRTAPRFQWSEEAQMHVSVDFKPDESTVGGAPSAVLRIATMNSHEFISQCSPVGETLRAIMRRLEGWLGSQKMDVSPATCQRAIQAMISNGKLAKGNDLLYRRGPNA